MKKQVLSHWLRMIHLAKLADTIRFYFMFLKNLNKNRKFRKEFPGVVMPPNYLMYESFQMDRHKYFIGGEEDAQWIVDTVTPYIKLNSINLLDWGCGPARIIRHMPDILGPDNQYFGIDYNPTTIKWCKANIPGITFSQNEVNPPLDFQNDYFTLIYGISILTHLSEENQSHWSKELNRIIHPNGIVLLTTHGEAFKEKLTQKEIEIFDKNELVSRVNVKEGHRMYGAFHPPEYIKGVFENVGFQIVDHKPGRRIHESYISQDVWLLKKKDF